MRIILFFSIEIPAIHWLILMELLKKFSSLVMVSEDRYNITEVVNFPSHSLITNNVYVDLKATYSVELNFVLIFSR